MGNVYSSLLNPTSELSKCKQDNKLLDGIINDHDTIDSAYRDEIRELKNEVAELKKKGLPVSSSSRKTMFELEEDNRILSIQNQRLKEQVGKVTTELPVSTTTAGDRRPRKKRATRKNTSFKIKKINQ